MKQTAIAQFTNARRVGVPIVSWQTPDPAATIEQVLASLGTQRSATPAAKWDSVAGYTRLTDCAQIQDGEAQGNPTDALILAGQIQRDGIVFMFQAHRHLSKADVAQGVWNLREPFKALGAMLVMLSPSCELPAELAGDVLVIDEELPDAQQLAVIVDEQVKCAEMPKLKDEERARVVDALSGLHAYGAEQSLALSIVGKTGARKINHDTLWNRKRQAIEATDGLRVWSGGETFADIAGVENAKQFVGRVIHGRRKPRGIVWIDELEKQLGGVQGDSSGTTQDQLGVMLQTMENTNALAMLLVGHPGSAKSMLAKAASAEAGVVGVQLDLGGMKAKHVGDSEQNIRRAVKVIDSVTQGCALYIATINKIDVIPPELQRRFNLGTFFFDLPDEQERAALWAMYRRKYEVADKMPAVKDDEGWTGADVKNCCERAWMFNISLEEAAKYATPVARTAWRSIEALRDVANGAFISASYSGLYNKDKAVKKPAAPTGRVMRD